MATERLQKLLASAGVASRRAAEKLIKDGHVRVNGRIVVELGVKADIVRDKVEVHGRRVVAEQPVYYLLHKPREVVTTLDDPEKRECVADLMKSVPERIFPVGRLDYHTSGALFLTNDGDMAQALLHPRKHVPKTYIAKFKGSLSLPKLQALREGVVLDDGERTRKADLFVLNEEHGNSWLQITITEGKNRQIHRMGDAIGQRVMRLSRVSFAGISIEGLRPGQSRALSPTEVARLKRDYLNPNKRAKGQYPEGTSKEHSHDPERREPSRRSGSSSPRQGDIGAVITPDREGRGGRFRERQGRKIVRDAVDSVSSTPAERDAGGGRFQGRQGPKSARKIVDSVARTSPAHDARGARFQARRGRGTAREVVDTAVGTSPERGARGGRFQARTRGKFPPVEPPREDPSEPKGRGWRLKAAHAVQDSTPARVTTNATRRGPAPSPVRRKTFRKSS
jgi:23S rRNA pseudouridine2605 synthase